MLWNIIADSSCDLHDGMDCAENVAFHMVPMSVRIGDLEFVDTPKLDVREMMEVMRSTSLPSSSACPSVEAWAALFEAADCSLAVTISSALSGSYNAAMAARSLVLEEHPEKKIHVVDSRSASGQMALVVERINQLIAKGLPFEAVARQAEAYNRQLRILFTLSHYDNLVKNGRMNKVVGMVVSTLKIRLIARGSDKGTIEMLYKVRGEMGALLKLVEAMGEQKDPAGLPVIITHCSNPEGAGKLKGLIEAAYDGVQIRLQRTHALTSYYAEEGGLIVSF